MTLSNAIVEAIELAAREGAPHRILLGKAGEYEVLREGEEVGPQGYWTELAVYLPDGSYHTLTA